MRSRTVVPTFRFFETKDSDQQILGVPPVFFPQEQLVTASEVAEDQLSGCWSFGGKRGQACGETGSKIRTSASIWKIFQSASRAEPWQHGIQYLQELNKWLHASWLALVRHGPQNADLLQQFAPWSRLDPGFNGLRCATITRRADLAETVWFTEEAGCKVETCATVFCCANTKFALPKFRNDKICVNTLQVF